MSRTSGGPYLPPYTGRGTLTRLVNRARRTVPRLAHFVEALAGVTLAERKTGLQWRPTLRVPANVPVVDAPSLSEALPRLVGLHEPGYARIGGLTYHVSPAGGGFVEVGGELHRREYASYQDYIEHQASKLSKEEAFVRGTSAQRYEKMTRRFKDVVAEASLSGHVLCLGARLGEEVRAFRANGLTAIGVDLNPGPGNPDCLTADFHHLPFLDDSFDGAYSNVLDHVFDIDRFMSEVVRVVRPGGFAYFELTGGFTETGAVDPYGATLWPTNAKLVEALRPYVNGARLDIDDARKSRRVIVLTIGKASRSS